jgi:hypothetical protein
MLGHMKKQGLRGKYCTPEHAARVTWRNLRDWTEAQMALTEVEMVEVQEVFLPYMVTGGQTFYHQMVQHGFPQLGMGDAK